MGVGRRSLTWKSAVTVQGGAVEPALHHQVVAGGPVAVAVEQGADDAAVEHPGEGVVVRLGGEVGDDLVALDEALDAEPLVVGGAAAEADALRRVPCLEGLRSREGLVDEHLLLQQVAGPRAGRGAGAGGAGDAGEREAGGG